MKIVRYCGIPLLLFALILCVPFASQAGISVRDAWDKSGELVVENAGWTAVFSRDRGNLSIYPRARKTVSITPFDSEKAQSILSCEVMEGKKEPVEVKALFSDGQSQMEGSFFFDSEGAVEIKPAKNMKGILISGGINFGIVPAPPLEDLVYDPKDYPDVSHVYLPSENLFLGLLKGEDRLFFCAWGDGDQKVRLLLKDNENAEKSIEAVEITLDGKSAHLRAISASGIWHREELRRIDLGKDVESKWKKPFTAKWKTQLLEGDIETNFNFATQKRRTWRPNFGFYEYPVWFDEDKTFFHISKKVRSNGHALIYALEEHDNTPVAFARKYFDSIPALEPKQGLLRYPLNNVGIRNCDGRAWMKWAFKLNLQTREKELLHEALADFLYSINVDSGRLDEYEAFIPKLKQRIDLWMQEEKKDTEAGLFLNKMKERVEELEQEYWSKMHDSPSSKHLQEETEVIKELAALVEEDGVEIYPEVVHLLNRIQLWSDIESVPGRVGALLREMSQQAGYNCANNGSLVKYAERIRRDIRAFIIAGETHETVY